MLPTSRAETSIQKSSSWEDPRSSRQGLQREGATFGLRLVGDVPLLSCAVSKHVVAAAPLHCTTLPCAFEMFLRTEVQVGGKLEDLHHDLIPATDPALPQAKRCIEETPEEERKFKNGKFARAHVHAWLAARKEPRPSGATIRSGDLLHDAGTAFSLADRLRKLFGP